MTLKMGLLTNLNAQVILLRHNRVRFPDHPLAPRQHKAVSVQIFSSVSTEKLIPWVGAVDFGLTYALSRVCSKDCVAESWSEHFVEIGHFQGNFDKVFRQSLTTNLGMGLWGQALSMDVQIHLGASVGVTHVADDINLNLGFFRL